MIKHITVVGGGLGGLAFAQGMRILSGYQVTVFERDKSPHHRSQGYQIGLNEDGLGCLSKLDLPGFKELVHENPLYGFMMTDHNLDGLVRFPIQAVGTGKEPKMSLVNRFKLRDILTTGLNVVWDKKFVSYEEKGDSVITHFEDGTSATSSLLVGADGVQSKVRAQYRPDLVFEKTGITSIAGFFPMALDTNNKLPKMKDHVKLNLGRSLLSDTQTMLFMRFVANDGQDNLLWSLSFNTEAAKAKFGELTQVQESPEALVQELVRRVQAGNCSPELSLVMSMTPRENILMPTETMTMRPGTVKPHLRPASLPPTAHRVVLLGDAAHAMTTHAGRGANTAFQDALLLSRTILGDKNCALDSPSWPAFHAKYEKQLYDTGMRAVKMSMDNTVRIHAQERAGPMKFMKFMGYCVKSWSLLTKGKFVF